jgi:MoaA/NifB/PqqE/SkfB family radical SAM enzyme
VNDVNPVNSLERSKEPRDGDPPDDRRGSSRPGTTVVEAGRKAAVYGFRHLRHTFDYHLQRGLAPPDKVAMVLTHRCNCRCVMCDLWRTGDARNELLAERWIALLDELHSWTRTLHVRFFGGEVLLKAGVYDIIRRAVHLGFTVNLISNGLALQSESNYRDLMNTRLRHITFSVDGKNALIHDRNRGTPGLHNVVSEVIRRMKRERPGMCVSLICILMQETVPQLAEYVQWAEGLGVDRILFQPLTENLGRPEKRAGWYRESNLFVRDFETLERSIDQLNLLGRRPATLEMPLRPLEEMREYFVQPESFQIRQGHCMLGQTDLQIDPSGILYMCDVKHTAFGHVDDGPVRHAWRSERARAVRRAIRDCQRPCASMCNRSPGLWEKAATFLRYARAGTL